MASLPDDLRLAYVVALTALVFACSLRFARRVVGGDWVETLLDALLLTLATQYVSVCLPGLFGVLDVWSIAVTAVLICGLLGAIARVRAGRRPPLNEDSVMARDDRRPAALLVAFVVCYLVSATWQQKLLAPVANDALTYHLPAAAQWLQDRRITLYETWYYNPANTYSPLAGSAMIAWWLAPMQSDVLARFAQVPALLLLMLAMIQIVRALGVSTTGAALVAAGAVTSRPFISQAILAKDDLFVAAFFASAVAAITRVKLTDALGPWRLGIALGLLLATKYTALLGVAMLLLAVDAPARAGWSPRRWLIAATCALALTGPWYARNIILTGNPLYPLDLLGLDGLFATRRSPDLAPAAKLWETFVTGYYSATIPAAAVLVVCWLAAVALGWRGASRSPLVRLCLLGPPLGVALFVGLSPYAEVRFIYPSLLLMFACAGVVAFRVRDRRAALAVAAVVFITGVATGFRPAGLRELLPGAILLSALVALVAWGFTRIAPKHRWRAATISAVVAIALAGCYTFVYFPGYVRGPTGYEKTTVPGWRGAYGPIAGAWEYVRERTPSGAVVAYANTFYTYPLLGFDLSRRVVYVPTRPGVSHLGDLPRSDRKLSGDEIVPYVTTELTSQPDRDVWLANLSRLAAEFLFVAKPGTGAGRGVPEIDFARRMPERFEPVFENDAAVVYRIVPPKK